MKVLLTHGYFLVEDIKEQRIMKPYPPLGLLYISSWLDKYGVENTVFDTTFSSVHELYSNLLAERPRILGIYVNLMTKPNVLAIIRFVTQNLPDTCIILGGPEVTHSAEKFLRAGAHAIVVGEGEETFLELAESILSGNGINTSIAGIALLDDNKFVQTASREKLRNIDALVPARHKINMAGYLDTWRSVHGRSTISVSTMRGCPYTCKWCSRAVYGLSYRRRTPAAVVEELKQIKAAYNPDSLWFVDDVFTISHKWMKDFAAELEKAEFRIPYECITRADRMNEEVIRLLKETGCYRVWIGAESGSQKVIDLMDRRVQVSMVREMIRMTRNYSIETGTFIMLGYPGETETDILETIEHLKESNPDFFTITLAYPIRGTELFTEAEINNPDGEWAATTDRELDFTRTYPRKYYNFAIRKVVNEVNYYKSWKNSSPVAAAKFKIKSVAAGLGMYFNR